MYSRMYSPISKDVAELNNLTEDKWMDFVYMNHGFNVRNLRHTLDLKYPKIDVSSKMWIVNFYVW